MNRKKRTEIRKRKEYRAESGPKEPKKLIRARFSATKSGFGFAAPLDHSCPDIFIPPQFVNRAIDGDIVSVELERPMRDRYSDRGPAGHVIEILERPHATLVAEVSGKRSARPLNRKMPDEVTVTRLPKGAKPGDWVKLHLMDTGRKRTESLYAEGIETLGKAGTVEADLLAIAAEFNLEDPYTDEQNAEAEKIEPETIDRTDMTRAFTVTIDPADAHDFDDAISIGRGSKAGEVKLGVHISDVAAFIAPGSAFDKESFKRGFSSYIPGMFRPMLPKALTQKISLKAGEKAPAHSVIFTIRKNDGAILDVKRLHTWVRIDHRLDYGTVQAYLNDPESAPKDCTSALKRKLNTLTDIVRKMRKLRHEREKFLDLPLPEIRVTCDEETKRVTGIERKEPCEADTLVEECMLAANSAVAEELIRRGLPGLFRIHPEPDPQKIDEFSMICMDSFHFSPGDILSSRDACLHFLASLPDDQRKPVILSLFLRSLPRASYSAEQALHYGLGKEKYSHFTSPIRRYTDLCVHQQLWALDQNRRWKSKQKIETIADECSLKEENNDNACFAASDRLKLHFLRENGALENATMYEAVITRVAANGLQCSIDELGIYGFIPRENLRGGDYRKHGGRQRMSAAQAHTSYRIGDFIYVALDSLDCVRGNAVFRPVV